MGKQQTEREQVPAQHAAPPDVQGLLGKTHMLHIVPLLMQQYVPSVLHTALAGQVPQLPPQPSSPQTLPAQLGTQQTPPLQVPPLGHVPQLPPQPSSPHFLPEHFGVQQSPSVHGPVQQSALVPQALPMAPHWHMLLLQLPEQQSALPVQPIPVCVQHCLAAQISPLQQLAVAVQLVWG
jgi:hypothetical protein